MYFNNFLVSVSIIEFFVVCFTKENPLFMEPKRANVLLLFDWFCLYI